MSSCPPLGFPRRSLARLSPLLWSVLLVAGAPFGFSAQVTPAEGAGPDPAARLAQVTSELEAVQERLSQATASGGPTEQLSKESELLGQQAALIAQQQALRDSLAELERESSDGRAELAARRSDSTPEAPPYSYLLLESLRDQARDEALRLERSAAAEQAARASLAAAQDDLQARERSRRLVKEEYERGDRGETGPRGASLLRQAELESRVASETVAVRELELAEVELARSLSGLRLEDLRTRQAYVEPRAKLTEADRTTIALDLARREERLRQAEHAAQRSLDYLGAQWLDAKRRLDQANPGEVGTTDEVETLKQGQTYRRAELSVLSARIQRIKQMRTLWDRRFAVFSQSYEPTDEEAWRAESQEALRALDIDVGLTTGHLSDVRSDLVSLHGQTAAEPEAVDSRWSAQRERHLQAMTEVYEEDLASLELLRRLHRKLLDDLGTEEASFGLLSAGAGVWARVLSVWRYELAAVDDSPITVGKIVSGLLLLFFGIFLSKVLSRLLGKRILPRLGLTEGALHALQSLVFYVLVVTVALVALRLVNVPLTAFTILGGALAIGFGFGSQNLVNNFISGLILLVERPVRASDLIQLDGLYGVVEQIGLRSTRVRTGENVEIIVPNSSFLQENVINWTLSGQEVRVMVAVGVTYGSPTREVREILRKVAVSHGRILKSPEPLVLFANFGDSALEFEVHFWIRMRSTMDKRVVESDLRFMIDSLCREAGIVIAFPQRDVHLDSARPLEVRMVSEPPVDAGSVPDAATSVGARV